MASISHSSKSHLLTLKKLAVWQICDPLSDAHRGEPGPGAAGGVRLSLARKRSYPLSPQRERGCLDSRERTPWLIQACRPNGNYCPFSIPLQEFVFYFPLLPAAVYEYLSCFACYRKTVTDGHGWWRAGMEIQDNFVPLAFHWGGGVRCYLFLYSCSWTSFCLLSCGQGTSPKEQE